MRSGIGVLTVTALCVCGSAAAGPADSIRPGTVVEAVACRKAPECSYALYLPAGYTPQRTWPIIYAFDPGARGVYPVRLYKDVAEKYGYIIAGSNDSQNFPNRPLAAAIQGMLEDTVERFAIDRRRMYTTGFSGGARVATGIALSCTACNVAGVVACGATYPANAAPSPHDAFAYVMGMGDTDFNYPELVQMQSEKERLGSPYRVRMFPGPHHWCPANVFEEAVEWFQLRAMQAGMAPKDEAFIREQRTKELAEAAQSEQAHDALREFFAYKSLVEDFQGLANTSEVKPGLEALKSSKELKKALEEESKEAERQHQLTRDIAPAVARFAANPSDTEARDTVLSGMERLKQTARKTKDARERRIRQRAFDALFADLIETGQQRKAKGKLSEALPFFELVSEAAPERPWPALLIAEARFATGDRKGALKAVRQAAKTGGITAEILANDSGLARLSSDPEFQKIVEELKEQPPPKPN